MTPDAPDSSFEPTPRTKAKRLPKRVSYDKRTVHSILDEACLAHVGFVDGGQPFVLPMLYGRKRQTLYLHGSAAGRQLRALASGAPVCLTVTLTDGLVLARSAFHHSMNYRCVVILGTAVPVTDAQEKTEALRVISDHLLPGRWAEVRGPNAAELKQTAVVAVALDECSAKVRAGPPLDDEEDYALPVWAGEVPTRLIWDEPVPDPRLPQGTPLPSYLRKPA